MRVRKLLLIHPNRSTRALIKKYIFSELCDIEIQEAEGCPLTVDLLDKQCFDVIVAADQLSKMPVTHFKACLASSKANTQAPLIIITESESNHQRNELAQQGFDRVAQIRVRPGDLIRKINAACNPRDWRKDTRYYLPGTGVSVCTPEMTTNATLINLSKGGILVEMETDQPESLMQNEVSIDLQVPAGDRTATIAGLGCKLLRIEVVAWNTVAAPRVMRVSFIFEGLGSSTLQKLNELIQMAEEDRLPATEVTD